MSAGDRDPGECKHGLATGTCSLCRERIPAQPSAPTATDRQLYAWQAEALEEWASASRRGIVEAVTGTGKTEVGIRAVIQAQHQGRAAVVLVPTGELLSQWHKNLSSRLPRGRLGLRGGGHRDDLRSHDVVVSIINSAAGGGLAVPPGSLLIGDECHRYAAQFFRTGLSEAYEWRLGLTATLERQDGEHRRLIDFFGAPCYRIGYARALADGVVTPFAVALIGIEMLPAEAVRYRQVSREISNAYTTLIQRFHFPTTPASAFIRELQQALKEDDHPANRAAYRFASRVSDRRQLLATSDTKLHAARDLAPAIRAARGSLIFTESVDACERLEQAYVQCGLRARALHSGLKADDRSALFSDFESGRLEAVLAPRLLDEGVDVPDADLAIVVAASRTQRQMIQRMGRVLRRKGDGRLARLAILYLKGTTEDPSSGAHEGFLSEVVDVADDVMTFGPSEIEEALCFLAVTSPYRSPPSPRLDGDPPRKVKSQRADDSVSAAQFYSVE